MTNIISSDNSVQINKLSGCDYDIKVLPLAGDGLIYSQQSPTVVLAGLGTPDARLVADVKVSPNPSNRLTIDNNDGLLVLPENISNSDEFVKVNALDEVAGFLIDKVEVGTNLALSVTGTTNKKLRLDFTGTLTPLINVANSSTVNMSGNGSVGTPVVASARVSGAAGNKLTVDGQGLFVPASDFTVGNTSTISLDKTANHLTATAKISTTSGNRLGTDAGGLFVSPEVYDDPHIVKVTEEGSADVLFNQVYAGIDPEGIVTLTFSVVDNRLVITPSIDIAVLCTKLQEAGCLCTTPSNLNVNIN